MPLKLLPVTCTIVRIGNQLFIDPCLEEEGSIDSRLSVAVSERGNVHALQLGGNDGMTMEEIDKAIEMAKKASIVLRKLLK